MAKRESNFQAELIKELRRRFPECIILKNDPNYLQGIPDLSIFYNDKYAFLECKKSQHEEVQPNQPYYVKKLNEWSFASFIYPENREEVLDELSRSFKA